MSKGHHVLFEANNWRAHKPNNTLRTKPGLIVPIEWESHDALHRAVPPVPPLHYIMGQTVLKLYRDNPDDHLRSIDNLMFAIEEASTTPRSSDLERRMGELVIAHIEAQIPYIREGIILD